MKSEPSPVEPARIGELVLLLGGARSGKSIAAERLARRGGSVLFVATAEALDEEMDRRIAAHRRHRPAGWHTMEEPLDPVAALVPVVDRYDTFVLDCLTLWVSNLLLSNEHASDVETIVLDAARRLLDLVEGSGATWILVSNEVGQGLVPPSPLGRAYRDALGRVNQLIASRADRVYLMVAGLALKMKPMGARPLRDVVDSGRARPEIHGPDGRGAPRPETCKVMTQEEWDGSIAEGKAYAAVSENDVRDGFIHCSTDEQLPRTLAKWYKSLDRVIVVTLDTDRLTSELRWEPNAEGELFPHVYGPIVPEAVAGAVMLGRNEAGEFDPIDQGEQTSPA